MKLYRVDMVDDEKCKYSVRVWAEGPEAAIQKARKDNGLENATAKSVKEQASSRLNR